MQTLSYIAKSAVLLSLFFLTYEFLLKRDTFFTQNRVFLLLGMATSILLPFVVFHKTVFVEPAPVSAPVVSVLSQPATMQSPAVQTPSFWEQFSVWDGLFYLYLAGVLFFAVKFIFQLYHLFVLLKNESNSFKKNGTTYIETDKPTGPFSFFNRVVYNPALYSETELDLILKHEMAHVENHHNIDIVLANLFTIFLWFNPLAFLYRKRIGQNLEFLADREATQNLDQPKAYQRSLVNVCTATTTELPITNFHNSFIKTRILMLHKRKSLRKNSLKALLILPFLGFFLMGFQVKTVTQVKPVEPVKPVAPIQPITPVNPVKTVAPVKPDVPVKNNPYSENYSITNGMISGIINKAKYFVFNGQKLSLDEAKGFAFKIDSVTLTKKDGKKTIAILGIKKRINSDADYTKKGRFLFITENKLAMVVSSSGLIFDNSPNSENTAKDLNIIFRYKITKNTTEAELKAYKKELKTKYDITFNYKNLNYNDEGELVGLKLSYKDNEAKDKGKYNTQSTTPIAPILFTKSNDEIGFKRTTPSFEFKNSGNGPQTAKTRKAIAKARKRRRKEIEKKRKIIDKKRKEIMGKRDSIADKMRSTRKDIEGRRKEIAERQRIMAKKREIMQKKRQKILKKREAIRAKRLEQKKGHIDTDYSFSLDIDKTSSDQQLAIYKNVFDQMGVEFSFGGIKRNDVGEIMAIKLKLDNHKGSKTSMSYKQDDETIPEIHLGYANGKAVFIQTSK